jgi:hypothetical protein
MCLCLDPEDTELGFQGHSDHSKIQNPGRICWELESSQQVADYSLLNCSGLGPFCHLPPCPRINNPTTCTRAPWQSRHVDQPGSGRPGVGGESSHGGCKLPTALKVAVSEEWPAEGARPFFPGRLQALRAEHRGGREARLASCPSQPDLPCALEQFPHRDNDKEGPSLPGKSVIPSGLGLRWWQKKGPERQEESRGLP